jgi:hypothetical protein
VEFILVERNLPSQMLILAVADDPLLVAGGFLTLPAASCKNGLFEIGICHGLLLGGMYDRFEAKNVILFEEY